MTEPIRPGQTPNIHERLAKLIRETAQPGFVPFSWIGDRVPERLAIVDPTDPEGKKMLVDIPIGYMRDGMMFDRKTGIIGTYERVIDYYELLDGTRFNAILVYPTDRVELEAAIMLFDELRAK